MDGILVITLMKKQKKKSRKRGRIVIVIRMNQIEVRKITVRSEFIHICKNGEETNKKEKKKIIRSSRLS